MQGYDRYAFVNNNPVRYTDTSGHCATDGDDWCFKRDTGGMSHIYNGPCANNAKVAPVHVQPLRRLELIIIIIMVVVVIFVACPMLAMVTINSIRLVQPKSPTTK